MDELKIGTPEAALASCVNLFSRLFNVPEDYARYYLDMYYQLRQQYEHQAEPEAAKKPKKARPAPAYPAPMRTMNEPKAPEAAADPPPAEDAKAGTDASAGPKAEAPRKHNGAADAAADKRRIRDRLLQMRQNGLSTPALLRAAGGNITEAQVADIIEAKPVPIAVYRLLDKVLEMLAAAPPET